MKLKISKHTIIFSAIALLLLVIIPLGNSAGVIDDVTINLWGRYLAFAVVAIGIDLVWGYTGVLSLCQALFFGLGGYAIAMHMALKTGKSGVYGSALPDFMVWNGIKELPFFWEPFDSFPLALIMGLLIPGLLAFILAFFAFRSRLKGVYFAIITQALAFAAYLLFLRNETMLGGTNGLTDFKTLLGLNLTDSGVKIGLYMTTATLLLVVYLISRQVVNSKLGKVLIAIRDSEHRVRYTGYSVTAFKVFIFVFAAIVAALGGMLYVPQTGIITPGRMDVQASIEMIVWVAVGGRGTLAGAALGALGVNMLYSYATTAFPGSWLYILGILFIAVVLLIPKGLIGLISGFPPSIEKEKWSLKVSQLAKFPKLF